MGELIRIDFNSREKIEPIEVEVSKKNSQILKSILERKKFIHEVISNGEHSVKYLFHSSERDFRTICGFFEKFQFDKTNGVEIITRFGEGLVLRKNGSSRVYVADNLYGADYFSMVDGDVKYLAFSLNSQQSY